MTYQQSIRREGAKRLLENESRSFDESTDQVGYEDSSTFRNIFIEAVSKPQITFKGKAQLDEKAAHIQ